MNYNVLGNTGIHISEIGFGCMSLGKTDEASASQLIQKAVNTGINYFDTADMYDKGANERLVGKALKPLRNKVVLATKVGNQWLPDGSGWKWNPKKTYILQSVEGSLRRLQTDRIDLYQLHGGTINDPIDETIDAFETLKQQGKILHYGISSIRPNVIREYVKRSKIVSVMMQYSLLDRRPEEAMLDLLQDNGISVLARGALAQGLLAGKTAKEYSGMSEIEVQRILEKLNHIEQSGSKKMSVALQFVLKKAAIASCVIGLRTEDQLCGIISSLNDEVAGQLIEELEKQIPSKIYEEHR